MKKPQVPDLQQIQPFSGLSPDGRKYIQCHLHWVTIPHGKTIIHEGTRGNVMAVIGHGQVEISSMNGEAKTLQPGDRLGESMLRYGVPSSFSAIAKTDVGLWVVKRSDWLVANGMPTESEANTLSAPAPRIPLWIKVGIVSMLLAILILRPLLPELTGAEMKDLARGTGRPDIVAEVLHYLLFIKPDSAQLQEALGYSLYMAGEDEAAVDAFNEALSLDIDSAITHNNLGVALTNPSQAPEAIEHLLIAVELDPSRADYYFNLGNAYFTNGDLPEAAESYQRAFDLDPSRVEARAMWAGIALENGDLEQAGSAWKKVLEINPDHVYANKGLGSVRVLEGRHGQALPYLEKALELDSQDDRTRYYLGLALLALDNPVEAAEEFEKILEVSPDPAVLELASNQLQLIGP